MEKKCTSGQAVHGFMLEEMKRIDEIDSDVFFFRHIGSGARLLKISNEDPNKTFSIGFKTFPDSDNGAPHILEHAVLNGSENFPVKSPFDILLKGSMSTFLNAFTSKDFTMYPVASMNSTDYFNLMHVYLDAVFNPMIYKDSRIFLQEGWHYASTGTEGPLTINGVVYNEMKGAFSNPHRELWYQVFRHLFPDNAYGFESGGTPDAIPGLSYHDFLDFHRRYYHPGNSYIFLYGNADLEEELAFIGNKYLNRFGKSEREVEITDQPPFAETRHVMEFYQYLGEDIDNQTFLTYNFVAGHNTDLKLTLALDILCEVLVNQESAPVRLALAARGIGQDVSASSSNFSQHAVQIAVMNANPGDKDLFLETLMEELRKAANGGLNRREMEGVINRIEFRIREGDDAQKGLTYLNMCLPRWFFADDPFSGLAYEKHLSEIKSALGTGYFESLISEYFLGNPHSLILTLAPSGSLEAERSEKAAQRLEEFRSTLGREEMERLAAETKELALFQQRDDTPEALATVPLLKLSDIGREATWFQAEKYEAGSIGVIGYEQFTNRVNYMNLLFDLKSLPLDLVPYASLLSAALGSLDAGDMTFSELNTELNISTGGFHTSVRTFLEHSDPARMLPRFVVSSKAMSDRTLRMFELSGPVILQSRFNNRERLHSILLRHHSQLDAQLKGNGYQVASRRFSSHLSDHGMLREMTGGLDYFRFITSLLKNFDSGFADLVRKLEETSGLLFTRRNLLAAWSGSAGDRKYFDDGLAGLSSLLPEGTAERHPWKFRRNPLREGIQAASNVQYVVKGANFRDSGYEWNGKMQVLSQVLSTEWLQTRIRVMGGAYGGFCSIQPSGQFTFSSYRDPNLAETLKNFDLTPDFLAGFEADDRAMNRFIIGTIADLDAPLTPSQRFDHALAWHLGKKSREEFQREREDILSATPADIRSFSAMTADILQKNLYCVYGNAEILGTHSGLFDKLISLENFAD